MLCIDPDESYKVCMKLQGMHGAISMHGANVCLVLSWNYKVCMELLGMHGAIKRYA